MGWGEPKAVPTVPAQRPNSGGYRYAQPIRLRFLASRHPACLVQAGVPTDRSTALTKPRRTAVPTPGYLLPEEAHEQLLSLCHYLHLLADLGQPEIAHPDDLILPRAGLAHCFSQLAEAADQIVGTAKFQAG